MCGRTGGSGESSGGVVDGGGEFGTDAEREVGGELRVVDGTDAERECGTDAECA